MRISKKKIQLIDCGGLNLPVKEQNDQGLKRWLKTMPELVLLAEIKPKFLSQSRPAANDFKEWQELARHIFKNHQQFAGFIVVQKPEKARNAAIALSFMLAGLRKPVIFTGESFFKDGQNKKINLAGLLGDYRALSIKVNIINALQAANCGAAGVCFLTGHRLIKAVRPPDESGSDDAGAPLSKAAFNISLGPGTVSAKKTKLRLLTELNSKVLYLKIYPGFPAGLLDDLLKKNDALILDFTEQDSAILDFDKIAGAGKPVVLYNPPHPPEDPRFIIIDHILPAVLTIKLMWVLGQTTCAPEVKKILMNDAAGEFLRS